MVATAVATIAAIAATVTIAAEIAATIAAANASEGGIALASFPTHVVDPIEDFEPWGQSCILAKLLMRILGLILIIARRTRNDMRYQRQLLKKE